MKSIILSIPSIKFINIIISIKFVILAFTCISSLAHSSPTCGLYGAPPCRYLPAPPGQTPSCARPGKTYCEHIDNYPTYLIKHLIHKWGYEAKNLIVDETWDEFHALTWHGTPVFYDPAFIFPPSHPAFSGNQNDFGGYDYDTPPPAAGAAAAAATTTQSGNGYGPNIQQEQSQQQPHTDFNYPKETTFLLTKQQQTTPPPTFLFYSSAGQHLNKNGYGGHNKLLSSAASTPNNPTFWLKRIVRDLSHSKINQTTTTTTITTTPATSTRDVSLNMDLYEIMGIEQQQQQQQERLQYQKKARFKRQSPGRSSLCQTTSQFVAPQAALNNKGNWMFVVNEPSSARQLVKAELCASNTCSNLCQLPTGYNSRCEQKFAQKRLIALQANGQNLYTDTFWFPSCCVCTISAN